jgi:hypothetical protein
MQYRPGLLEGFLAGTGLDLTPFNNPHHLKSLAARASVPSYAFSSSTETYPGAWPGQSLLLTAVGRGGFRRVSGLP